MSKTPPDVAGYSFCLQPRRTLLRRQRAKPGPVLGGQRLASDRRLPGARQWPGVCRDGRMLACGRETRNGGLGGGYTPPGHAAGRHRGLEGGCATKLGKGG